MTEKKKRVLKTVGEVVANFMLLFALIFALIGMNCLYLRGNSNAEENVEGARKITASAEEVMTLAGNTVTAPVITIQALPFTYKFDFNVVVSSGPMARYSGMVMQTKFGEDFMKSNMGKVFTVYSNLFAPDNPSLSTQLDTLFYTNLEWGSPTTVTASNFGYYSEWVMPSADYDYTQPVQGAIFRFLSSPSILNVRGYVAVFSGNYEQTKEDFFKLVFGNYEEGKTDGYNEGFTAGKTEGYDEGFNAGKTEGIEEGKKQGYQNGYDDALKEQMIPVAVLTQTTVSPVSDFYMESFTASDSVITWKPKEGAQGGGLNGVRCQALTPLLPNVTYLFRYSSTMPFRIGFWESSYNALTLFPNPSSFEAGENKEVYFTMPVAIYDGSSYAYEGTNLIYIYTDSNDYEITIKNASILQVTDASSVYQEGYEAGERVGYDSGYDTGNTEGYNKGYSAGLELAQKGSFFNLISAVIDAPVIAFTSLFEFEVFGFSMKSFMLTLLTAALVMCVLRIFTGKGVR